MESNISLNECLAILFHKSFKLPQFLRPKPVIADQRNGFEPELCLDVAALDMNVGWLVGFTTVKMKSVRANAQHCRHARIVCARQALSNLHVLAKLIPNTAI
jgi:hypothetical protein